MQEAGGVGRLGDGGYIYGLYKSRQIWASGSADQRCFMQLSQTWGGGEGA